MARIDKGIPIPMPVRDRPTRKYDFYIYEVGDSQFYPGVTSKWLGSRAHNAARISGFKFTVRTVVEHSVPGCRIWRIK
jgi:hypothetical protein